MTQTPKEPEDPNTNEQPAPLRRPLHDRYTWLVKTVPLDSAQAALDETTMATHEVYATHVVQHPSLADGAPHLVIVARQHGDIFRTLTEDEIDHNVRKTASRGAPVFRKYGRAPSSGFYRPECGHSYEQEYVRGVQLGPCPVCKKDVGWGLVAPKPFP